MKKVLVAFGVIVLLLTSCAAAPTQESVSVDPVDSRDISQADVMEGEISLSEGAHESTADERDAAGEAEIAGIVFMREEEKLARDVYLQLAEVWGMNIFSNIASSEETHMDAVLGLIDMAGVEDPAQDMDRGEFLNQDLQDLYDHLVERGEENLGEALLVGAAIEEIDILDLQEYLAETEDPYVIEVYQNLLKGSINHLNAFVRTYERQTGEEYQPQYLTTEAYQALLTEASSRGAGGGQGRSAK